MQSGARLSVVERRATRRRPMEYPVIAEHSGGGDIVLNIVNVSTQGFMARGQVALSPGERVMLRLPAIGRIEAHLVWRDDARAGFQFERVIRLGEITHLLDLVQPNHRLREPVQGVW